ncbi:MULTISPECIES: hypothetical protein [unclassified Streptomyces]|uniref:hypothetical protein n=1 Tax=unclassified Streptomyces TaxID=2593676 RepID=UPI000CD55FD8|nr:MULTISPECIES: hypothetical protein [unclassified Streptomyces]
MSMYEVTADGVTVRARTLRDAQAVVMESITGLLASDPEGAAQGALMAKRAFAEGTVEHTVTTRGSWETVVTVQGRPVRLTILKAPWWRRWGHRHR